MCFYCLKTLNNTLFLKVSLPNGMTGNVQFNREGKRVNYTLLLYSHGGLQLYHKVWTLCKDNVNRAT